MQATIVLFPGLNADAEMLRTLRDVCGAPTRVVRHTDSSLPEGTDLVAIPGGFSYGDYLRCGAIAKGSAIIPALRAHAAHGGYVLGVCNGFQILTEVGLLPGALTRNQQLRFECGDWHVRVASQGPFTRQLGAVWKLPIAHAEGRYQAPADVLQKLEDDGNVALRYCALDGTVAAEFNPNGSAHGIAGIYGGPSKNILGLMPHPERMSEPLQGGTDGRALFENVFAA